MLALFALDERLGGIVRLTTEPMIGLVRLAWWREALERLDHAPAPAEPLLRALAADVLPHGVTGAELSEIEDGWAALLGGEPDGEALDSHARERGGRLFLLAARLLATLLPGPDAGPIAAAGAGWALADLAQRHTSPPVRAEARARARAALAAAPRRWPSALRPLGTLAALAKLDAGQDGPRAQGSPRRVARMLAMRLFGR